MAGRRYPAYIAFLALAFLFAACASTKLVETWKDNQFKGPAYKKIMVVSLMKQPDTRQRIEDEFAGQLNAKGVSSVTCYSCILDPKDLTREEIVKAVGKTGVEGVLVVELRQAGTRIESVLDKSPTMGEFVGFDSYMLSATANPYDSAMVRRDEVVTLSTRLFDAGTGKLIWYSNTETVDPGKTEREIASFAQLILNTLQKEKLI